MPAMFSGNIALMYSTTMSAMTPTTPGKMAPGLLSSAMIP
jgi:hypothetical protein